MPNNPLLHNIVLVVNTVKVYLQNNTPIATIHLDADGDFLHIVNTNIVAIVNSCAIIKAKDQLYTTIAAKLYMLYNNKQTFGQAATVVEQAYQQWKNKFN